jgi:PhoPQ-activated pathogenicity-related protein
VDPWFYRERLQMPKLLINGANDRYWATDATRLYWNDLRGDKYLLSIPNAGHGLEDRARLLNTLAAFFHSVSEDAKLPQISARQEKNGSRVTVRLTSSARPREARLWTARAADLDFRPVRWEMTPLRENGNAYVGEVEVPATGGVAIFTEAEFERGGKPFTLSTPSEVFGTRPAAANAGE